MGNPALIKEAETTGDLDLKTILGWSLDVNEGVAKIVRNVPPFPGVIDSLERLQGVVRTRGNEPTTRSEQTRQGGLIDSDENHQTATNPLAEDGCH